MYKQQELLTIVRVVVSVLPINRGVKTLNLIILHVEHILLGNLSRRDTVRKLRLWLVHPVHDRLEKERKSAVDWNNLVGKHLLGISTRLRQDAYAGVLGKRRGVYTL